MRFTAVTMESAQHLLTATVRTEFQCEHSDCGEMLISFPLHQRLCTSNFLRSENVHYIRQGRA